MTERRIDRRYGARMMAVNALWAVPGLIALVLAAGRAARDAWFFALAAVFLACLAAGIVIAVRRRVRGYCCPQCGARIGKPVGAATRPGAPVDYWCPQCDVLWYTRAYAPDNGG
jgi:predicted RNA-binding Zn-ribbon protein involved in translation (DUF1610 family)